MWDESTRMVACRPGAVVATYPRQSSLSLVAPILLHYPLSSTYEIRFGAPYTSPFRFGPIAMPPSDRRIALTKLLPSSPAHPLSITPIPASTTISTRPSQHSPSHHHLTTLLATYYTRGRRIYPSSRGTIELATQSNILLHPVSSPINDTVIRPSIWHSYQSSPFTSTQFRHHSIGHPNQSSPPSWAHNLPATSLRPPCARLRFVSRHVLLFTSYP